MESGLDSPCSITSSLEPQRGGILRYILDRIPDAKRCILSSLYPFDVAKVLMVTGHVLTLREKSIYINPLYDVMRHPRIVEHFDRAGVKMILVGGALDTIKSRVLDPKRFKDSYNVAELGVVALLFTGGAPIPRPMYRFIYEEGSSQNATKMDEFMVKIHMKHRGRPVGGSTPYYPYHSIHSRTSQMIGPPSHDTTTIVFVPDEEDLRKNALVLRPGTVPDLYTMENRKTSLSWAQVMKSPSRPEAYIIGPVNRARAVSGHAESESHMLGGGLTTDYHESIVVRPDEGEGAYFSTSYRIPLSACL